MEHTQSLGHPAVLPATPVLEAPPPVGSPEVEAPIEFNKPAAALIEATPLAAAVPVPVKPAPAEQRGDRPSPRSERSQCRRCPEDLRKEEVTRSDKNASIEPGVVAREIWRDEGPANIREDASIEPGVVAREICEISRECA